MLGKRSCEATALVRRHYIGRLLALVQMECIGEWQLGMTNASPLAPTRRNGRSRRDCACQAVTVPCSQKQQVCIPTVVHNACLMTHSTRPIGKQLRQLPFHQR